MNKEEMIEQYNDLYIRFGYCLLDSAINKNKNRHSFKYDNRFKIIDNIVNFIIDIDIICSKCNYKTTINSVDFEDEDRLFNNIILYGIENFFNNDIEDIWDINNILYTFCESYYRESLIDRKISKKALKENQRWLDRMNN